MSRSAQLAFPHRWFPRKRYVPLISIKKACGLTYHERLVYSFLVYRRSRDQGATKKKIAERLAIDRGETVPKVLEGLAVDTTDRPRLVEERDGRYYAVQPSGPTVDWFAYNGRTREPWHRQFSTFPVFIPTQECPLTAKVNGLLWLLWSLAPRWGKPFIVNQNQKGLAVLMGASQKFIRSALETLRGHRLVKVGTLAYFMLQPTAEQLAWWRDRPAKKDRKEARKFVLSQALGWKADKVRATDEPRDKEKKEDMASICRAVDLFAGRMIAKGFTEEEIVNYWTEVENELRTVEGVMKFTWLFEELFREAEAIHGESGYARSSIGILRSVSQKAIENIRAGRF